MHKHVLYSIKRPSPPLTKSTFRAFSSNFGPVGFSAGGISVGIKKDKKLDLSYVSSKSPCTVAGLFTKNQFKAAPVLQNLDTLERSRNGEDVYGVVCNSGCANAVTGHWGINNAYRMASAAENLMGGHALVMSTGVIGRQLPIDLIEDGIPKVHEGAKNDEQSWRNAAEAIMTTDTHSKLHRENVTINGVEGTIVGMCKGAGMIHPNMGTMLAAIYTDLRIPEPVLDHILRETADRTFHCIDVDGDTSTNDTVLMLANGAAGNSPILVHTEEHTIFADSVGKLMKKMCLDIVEDSEGATKVVTAHVQGALSTVEARNVAMAVARSTLVKCFLFGGEPNWGRVLCAIGNSGVLCELNQISLRFESSSSPGGEGEIDTGVQLLANGVPDCSSDSLSKAEKLIIDNKYITLRIDLGIGEGEAKVYFPDLSKEYVSINAEYLT